MNLSELKTLLRAYLDQDESELPDTELTLTIQQGEAELRRVFFSHPRLEQIVNITLTDGAGTLPDNFGPLIEVLALGSTVPLCQVYKLGEVNTGSFLLSGTAIQTDPSIASLTLRYYGTLPALTNNEGNWLADKNPDLYLYGCLKESALYARNKTWLPDWGGEFDRRAAQERRAAWNTRVTPR